MLTAVAPSRCHVSAAWQRLLALGQQEDAQLPDGGGARKPLGWQRVRFISGEVCGHLKLKSKLEIRTESEHGFGRNSSAKLKSADTRNPTDYPKPEKKFTNYVLLFRLMRLCANGLRGEPLLGALLAL